MVQRIWCRCGLFPARCGRLQPAGTDVHDCAGEVGRCRAPTLRYRLYAVAGQIVEHSRQLVLKLDMRGKVQFDEVLWSIRTCAFK